MCRQALRNCPSLMPSPLPSQCLRFHRRPVEAHDYLPASVMYSARRYAQTSPKPSFITAVNHSSSKFRSVLPSLPFVGNAKSTAK
ncbi:uncharacterized protein TRIVIDRAFT_91667 [Trichoderma virens Gv29-8]|uniref:Uncharacterized protein n=1 Tax=Hypocrea virens (strain Gv29-8 / FGSC 10586) TaxID=413071 RepID=G9MKY8_HYPVG|nr:uncharacterized protein TRIVIDRAFT_91667 [Trichoderma virens Gv29-8]EHK24882.1 hypothetical protein TRIVIDRAFT_91667 [Trichoderma virens Gv29-8]